mmetsp:Transcript_2866/g.6113  ORF Transcript_2866/g.6113 Transcript_2866/m.6113 type:complete len:84 (+) Transcript_2866:661-912(+)
MVWANRTDLSIFLGEEACIDSASDAAERLAASVAETELDPPDASQIMQSPSLTKAFLIRGAMVIDVLDLNMKQEHMVGVNFLL